MRYAPGFVNDLRLDIESIRQEHRLPNRQGSFSEDTLLSLVGSIADHSAYDVEKCDENEPSLKKLQDISSTSSAVEAIRSGKVAFVVLAGGSGSVIATPHALLRLPRIGITLLANKITQSVVVSDDGEALCLPTWIMTSPSLLRDVATHLSALVPMFSGVLFEQFESYTLRPDNRLDIISPGVPSLHPTGTGDVGPALIESGLLDENPQIEHCIIVNCNNCLASPDLKVLSHHIESQSQVTCEVVKREKKDAGGVLCWSEGRIQVVESFQLDGDFVDSSAYQSTNTFIISANTLKAGMQWKWHRVRKNAKGRLVVKYERFIQQYTEAFEAKYVIVNRCDRYLPVKTESDLGVADKLLNGNVLR